MKKTKKIKINLNGKTLFLAKGTRFIKLLKKTKLQPNKIAIELNKKIIKKKNINKIFLKNKDKIEIVHFIGGGLMKKDFLKISSKKFNSRLIVGTGKYKSFLECSKAIKASGAEIVTVAVRRVNISDKKNQC